MRERQTTVYYCDHCNKRGFYKANIKKHEETCFGNPENVPACLQRHETIPDGQCTHLTKGGPNGYYYCEIGKKVLHTKRTEVLKYPISEGSQLMPEQCIAYQCDIEIIKQETSF